MKKFKIITLPGDGIGPEITSSAVKMLNAISDLNDINKEIKAEGKETAKYRKTIPATFEPILMGITCLLYTSPSPRDRSLSRMPSSA